MAKTILIVEDEPCLLNLLARRIGSLGFRVETARNGDEAIGKLKSRRIDLVMLDMVTPRRNGLQVLQTLRGELASKAPVIVLSNLEQDEAIRAVKSYGVSEYIVKSKTSMKELSGVVMQTLGEGAAR